MANDSSLQGGDVQFAYDLDSQKGVTHLLASIRASHINPEQKNELRDLVFSYANGGRDQTVRITIEQKIHTYGVVPLVLQVKAIAAEINQPKHLFGTSRPSPSFVVGVKSNEVKIKEAQPAVETIVPPPREVVAPTPAPIINVVPEPVVPSVPAEAPAPTAPPVPPTALASTPVVETPTPVIADATVESPLPQAAESVIYDSGQALQRIREIKSLVNDKVGNPVNLVDIDNEVGREYMGALLDAMKKLNTGTSVISSMKRLETAYLSVEKTIAKHNSEGKSQSEPAPVVVPKPSEPIVPAQPIGAGEITPVKPIEQKVVENVTPPPVSTPVDVLPVAPQPKPVEPAMVKPVQPQVQTHPDNLPTSQPKPLAQPLSAQVPRPDPIQAETKPEPVKISTPPPLQKPREPEMPTAWGAETDTVRKSEKAVADTFTTGKASSLADVKVKLRTPDELPLASSLETSSVEGDNLFTKSVDEGLEQLLLEWVLFKKSGLFGTGPKGREHPLFLKVAQLQIPLLLAGRFEGATQEIKQSITDYMNGWRYEQGIIYEQGETFEHYLRRVIRHILDLQKK